MATSDIGWHDLDKRKFYVFGPTIFLGVRLLSHPVMVVKTRLQINDPATGRPKYSGTGEAMRTIWRTEGLRGFYRGFATNSLNLLVGQLYITVFEYLKTPVLFGAETPEAVRSACAALCAAAISQAVGNPIDVVAQKQMVLTSSKPGFDPQAPPTAATQAGGGASTSRRLPPSTAPSQSWGSRFQSVSMASDIIRKEGVAGFYRGYAASILQNAPSSALWWTSYGIYRRFFLKQQSGERTWIKDRLTETISGSMAGATVAVVASPLDVVRTRVQVESKTVTSVVRKLFATEGVAGLFAGLSARLIMLAGNGAVIMSAYELVKRLSIRDGCDGQGPPCRDVVAPVDV